MIKLRKKLVRELPLCFAIILTIAISLSTFVVSIPVSAAGPNQDQEIELKYDQDTARDFISVVPPYFDGYVVDFNAPGDTFLIKSIRVCGLCSNTPKRDKFELQIWDRDQNVIYKAEFPVTLFKTWPMRGWSEIPIPNIKVQDKFFVHIYTGTNINEGIHIGADDTIVNEHSNVTVRADGVTSQILPVWPYYRNSWFGDKSKVNWMIRVKGIPGADNSTQGFPQELGYDDGVTICYAPPIYGEGYLIDYKPTVSPFLIKKIRMYGTVKGTSTRTDFELEILDKDYKVMYSMKYPISKFAKMPDSTWVDIDIPDIKANDKFYVHIIKGVSDQGLDQGLLISTGYSTDGGGHANVTTGKGIDGSIQVSNYWPYRCPAEKNKSTWMVRVVGTSSSKTSIQGDKADYEFLKCQQVVDVVTPQKAHVLCNLGVTNTSIPELRYVDMSVGRPPSATSSVNRVFDDQGEIKYDFSVGQTVQNIQSVSDTIRVYFREAIKPGETTAFSVDLDQVSLKPFEYVYACCTSSDRIFKSASLAIVAPLGYRIVRLDPPNAKRQDAKGRETAALEINMISGAQLIAYLDPVVTAPSQATDESGGQLPVNIWQIAILGAIGLIIVASAAFLSFKLALRLLVRRKHVIIQDEDFQKKLEEWEKEGYDLDEIKKKWQKEK